MEELKIKKFWQSRTFWTALVGSAASFAASYFGYEIPAQVQVTALTVIFFILRLDTKYPIQF